tara:strand:- start:3960 stop:4139 length:180 start_codon:yes stop_codon:yes gene_type:complete
MGNTIRMIANSTARPIPVMAEPFQNRLPGKLQHAKDGPAVKPEWYGWVNPTVTQYMPGD